ncbi:antibiotic biosynthesis monooxygenase [Tumebacillus avium]|uniref:Antibiotic biosynthesis monooxygenase n=1 Tax=Tumebacillus avium TaxID=1903704 RepID=A0A1Y0ISP5_9BACL|nr:putative quinol monooxygenase [Tumebacillus avium]ARU63662.1 antibiotic biosynthesis monooxygenase [Tumebacillus avium]
MIIIHAYIKVKPERREEYLELSKGIVAGSQAEAGNLAYQLFEEAGNPNSFVIVEKWKDQAAVDFHNQTAHFQSFISAVPELLAEPTRVELFDAVEKK